MDSDVGQLASVLTIVFAFAAGMLVLAKAAQVAFRPEKRSNVTQLAPGVDEARFARLEEAVESIAIEIERISEAQRFSTRLLTERASERVASQAAEQEPARLPSSRA